MSSVHQIESTATFKTVIFLFFCFFRWNIINFKLYSLIAAAFFSSPPKVISGYLSCSCLRVQNKSNCIFQKEWGKKKKCVFDSFQGVRTDLPSSHMLWTCVLVKVEEWAEKTRLYLSGVCRDTKQHYYSSVECFEVEPSLDLDKKLSSLLYRLEHQNLIKKFTTNSR